MKPENQSIYSLKVIIFFIIVPFMVSCNSSKWIVPAEYIGQWETTNCKITVRTKLKNEPFRFYSDYASVTIKINDDKTVSGVIGTAIFENGKLRKNGGNPEITGIAYCIECGSIGKIFDIDPLVAKEVEIWLCPLTKQDQVEAELRYTEGWAMFPMAGLNFIRVKDVIPK